MGGVMVQLPEFQTSFKVHNAHWNSLTRQLGSQIVCDIFDIAHPGWHFYPSDLVDEVPCLRRYAVRTQIEVIRFVCRQLVIEHTTGNPLLIREHGKYVVPDIPVKH